MRVFQVHTATGDVEIRFADGEILADDFALALGEVAHLGGSLTVSTVAALALSLGGSLAFVHASTFGVLTYADDMFVQGADTYTREANAMMAAAVAAECVNDVLGRLDPATLPAPSSREAWGVPLALLDLE